MCVGDTPLMVKKDGDVRSEMTVRISVGVRGAGVGFGRRLGGGRAWVRTVDAVSA